MHDRFCRLDFCSIIIGTLCERGIDRRLYHWGVIVREVRLVSGGSE